MKEQTRTQIRSLARQFVSEHVELCDTILRKASEFVTLLDRLLQTRNDLVRLLIELRYHARNYAARNVVDERKLLTAITKFIGYQRIHGKEVKTKHWQAIYRRINSLEKLYGHNIFESDAYDEDLMKSLRFNQTIDAVTRLRDRMRAMIRHYALLTSVTDAIYFLQELMSQLEEIVK